MRKEGKLTISAGFSRLLGMRLMKGALDNGGFGRATDFLEQDRQLESGDPIFADGDNQPFDGSTVFLITDAGLSTSAGVSLGSKKPAKSKKPSKSKKPAKSKKTSKAKKTSSAAKSKKPAAKRSTKKR